MDALLGFIGLGILGFLIGKILVIILLPIHFSRNENNRRIGAEYVRRVFLVVLFSIFADHSKTSLANTVSLEDTAKVIFISLNTFLLLLANVCPKITPNKWFGIRTLTPSVVMKHGQVFSDWAARFYSAEACSTSL
ncbi:MAG: hypothetical protein ACLT8E_03930 [Akkermansia sp.]